MQADTHQRYATRLRRVVEHVDAHLDSPLDVAGLASIAVCSPFHFQRLFAAWAGVGPYRYIQLARLRRAAHQLAFEPGHRVLEIAIGAGFSSGEAFARAFRQEVGCAPSEFRADPRWRAQPQPFTDIERIRKRHMQHHWQNQVETIEFPETRVAVLRHRGSAAQLPASIRRFIEWRRGQGLSPQRSATWNLLYTDPLDTPPDRFRIDLCCSISDRTISENPAGVVEGVIPAGRCARLRLVGEDSDLGPALDFLYRDWLPGSGEALRDFPPFVERVRFPPEVVDGASEIDVYLPLDAAAMSRTDAS